MFPPAQPPPASSAATTRRLSVGSEGRTIDDSDNGRQEFKGVGSLFYLAAGVDLKDEYKEQ